jgi:ADP-ribose pyrophosphatase YjhB (NUDIX family)|tara:strand:+ start:150 stop:566 length:417 start_codon:yes stop_codon:yes gene_type:complete
MSTEGLTRQPLDTKEVSKVIVVSERKVLLLLRKKGQSFEKQWDLPGGHLHVGEGWEPAAIRETKEETNLSVENLKLVHKAGGEAYFVAVKWTGYIYAAEELPEHDAYTWLTLEEINKLDNFSDKYYNVVSLVLNKLGK